jgi:hypothetical protein
LGWDAVDAAASSRGAIDAAIVLRHDDRCRDGETILEEAFAWMAAPDFAYRTGEPLRLAAQAEPCSVRSMAIDAYCATRASPARCRVRWP